jgi:hypothetical protein
MRESEQRRAWATQIVAMNVMAGTQAAPSQVAGK